MVGADIIGTTLQLILLGNTTYYWQVIGKIAGDEIIESAIWSFFTLDTAPDEVILSLPDSGASDVALSALLEWQLISETDAELPMMCILTLVILQKPSWVQKFQIFILIQPYYQILSISGK